MRDIRVEIRNYSDVTYYEEVGEIELEKLTEEELATVHVIIVELLNNILTQLT